MKRVALGPHLAGGYHMHYAYVVMAGKYSAERNVCAFLTERDAREFAQSLCWAVTDIESMPLLTSVDPTAMFDFMEMLDELSAMYEGGANGTD